MKYNFKLKDFDNYKKHYINNVIIYLAYGNSTKVYFVTNEKLKLGCTFNTLKNMNKFLNSKMFVKLKLAKTKDEL